LEKLVLLKIPIFFLFCCFLVVKVNAQERIGFYHFEEKNPFQRIDQFSIPLDNEPLVAYPSTPTNERKSIDMMRDFEMKERRKAFVAQSYNHQLAKHQQNLKRGGADSKEGKVHFRAQPTYWGDGFYPPNSFGNPSFGNPYQTFGNPYMNNGFYPYRLSTMQRGNIYAW